MKLIASCSVAPDMALDGARSRMTGRARRRRRRPPGGDEHGPGRELPRGDRTPTSRKSARSRTRRARRRRVRRAGGSTPAGTSVRSRRLAAMPASERDRHLGAREHNLGASTSSCPRDALIVITGLSGSGKSSLAFDTIYAEGQRRYVESLSAYARQFLGLMDKPDVDSIEGLSPAISIDQKTTSRNPRSTVGTVTEIYDYLRLLWARIGKPHCPECGEQITGQSIEQIIDRLMTLDGGDAVHGPRAGRPRAQGRVREAARADARSRATRGPRRRRAAPPRRGDRARQEVQARHLRRGRPAGDEGPDLRRRLSESVEARPLADGLVEVEISVGSRGRSSADLRAEHRQAQRDALFASSSPASTAAPRSPSSSRGSSPSTRPTAPASAATGSASSA